MTKVAKPLFCKNRFQKFHSVLHAHVNHGGILCTQWLSYHPETPSLWPVRRTLPGTWHSLSCGHFLLFWPFQVSTEERDCDHPQVPWLVNARTGTVTQVSRGMPIPPHCEGDGTCMPTCTARVVPWDRAFIVTLALLMILTWHPILPSVFICSMKIFHSKVCLPAVRSCELWCSWCSPEWKLFNWTHTQYSHFQVNTLGS